MIHTHREHRKKGRKEGGKINSKNNHSLLTQRPDSVIDPRTEASLIHPVSASGSWNKTGDANHGKQTGKTTSERDGNTTTNYQEPNTTIGTTTTHPSLAQAPVSLLGPFSTAFHSWINQQGPSSLPFSCSLLSLAPPFLFIPLHIPFSSFLPFSFKHSLRRRQKNKLQGLK